MLRARFLRLAIAGLLSLQVAAGLGSGAWAQDGALREGGKVVGTTGLNIRECPMASCESLGLAQLGDDIIVTGAAQDGFLPVDWEGKAGWAWQLYVATPSRGTPYLIRGTPGCNRVAFLFNIGIGNEMQMQALEWLKANDVPATDLPDGLVGAAVSRRHEGDAGPGLSHRDARRHARQSSAVCRCGHCQRLEGF